MNSTLIRRSLPSTILREHSPRVPIIRTRFNNSLNTYNNLHIQRLFRRHLTFMQIRRNRPMSKMFHLMCNLRLNTLTKFQVFNTRISFRTKVITRISTKQLPISRSNSVPIPISRFRPNNLHLQVPNLPFHCLPIRRDPITTIIHQIRFSTTPHLNLRTSKMLMFRSSRTYQLYQIQARAKKRTV